MKRYYYSDTISNFCNSKIETIIGFITLNNEYSFEINQKEAWRQQIELLQPILRNYYGMIFFEYSIPRMGKRIDVVLIIKNVIFVLEFKVGEKEYLSSAIDQVWDYALDLKNFHETSQNNLVAPILISTEAKNIFSSVSTTQHDDKLLFPIKSNLEALETVIESVLMFEDGEDIDVKEWSNGRYSPTPTIIEAATALYNNHSVADISRSDASAINLSQTSDTISNIIEHTRLKKEKAICFVTGVPGAGKTLVGLDVATRHMDKEKRTSSVYLSGNGPLVAVLREALTRDKVYREKEKGNKVKKGEVFSAVKSVIQNIHHFRDEYLKDKGAPFDHVAIFDEAQRAWDVTQTSNFMKRKKGVSNFAISEPEFLISCLNRHHDWAVIVCLVGGGQEINTGEAGISEWIESLNRKFQEWRIYVSNRLTDSEYAAGEALKLLEQHSSVIYKEELHLSVSMRSFRAEHVSLFVKNVLDLKQEQARESYCAIKTNYPIVLTRSLTKAKRWLKLKARGSERYGIMVSSQAQRLKPLAVDVRAPVNPIHWFLDGKKDVRSSYYLEDVATEFQVQGLELDWTCVIWDGDFRYSLDEWKCFSFVGSKWNNINKEERKNYLKNAYRVLLTRSRQGMVIVVPEGDNEDPTRKPLFYNDTFEYLKTIGLEVI